MAKITFRLSLLGLIGSFSLMLGAAGIAAEPPRCPDRARIVMQVLGSGGPELASGRAGSSYLVWVDGRARVLVDSGSGSLLRFVESGAREADLRLLALTHLHTDHAGDIVALAKRSFFNGRSRALPVSGPTGSGAFPAVDIFLERLLGREGAFGYLAGALDGTGGLLELEPIVVPAKINAESSAIQVFDSGGLSVQAVAVRHGSVPALGYRVNIADKVIVFSGDQDGGEAGFWELANDADLLVIHLAIPEQAGPAAKRLHATPSRWAEGIRQANVNRVVVSHLMKRSERNLEDSLDILADGFDGTIDVAEDLGCFPL
ncbi:MBL fold metallo-hydrolase [Kineobactrum sediminis]|uniref:MBL fold metallo-hydrolase n=1 Tax=Kineobactrum sediminis TaxID=1905677 RepID=A0A2N5Y2P5_9GAMM|nr:MBL fold metallo-hydrolase [Kineobactrum sediminis]PLW82665.1 MBL fold metallo-hydrolase [Kineobactrum sediminis]